MTKPPIPAWLDRLRRRFSPARLRLGAEGPRPLPGGGGSGVLGLVGRELCLYLDVDTSRVPARQRDGYVALAVRRAAPFSDPEHDTLWLHGRAAAWYWSRERVPSTGSAGERRRAEALFRGAVHGDTRAELLELSTTGADGLDTIDGYEARAWRDGHLAASRWWPQVPDERTWDGFVRGAGLQAGTEVPVPIDAPLRATPLGSEASRSAVGERLGQQRGLLAVAGATLLLGLLAWQGAGAARIAWRAHSAERQADSLSTGMERIIAARERADAARARIDAMLALHAPASQTRLLGEVKRLTPGQWQLLAWTQPDPETLEVTMRAAGADVAKIVAAWEASPLFEDVAPATASGNDEVVLRARLTPIDRQLAAGTRR